MKNKNKSSFETHHFYIVFDDDKREIYIQSRYKKDYKIGKKKIINAIKEIQEDEEDIREAKLALKEEKKKGTLPMEEMKKRLK